MRSPVGPTPVEMLAADWRATFRNAVREDWLKLWRKGRDGYFLTTAGEQAAAEMRA